MTTQRPTLLVVISAWAVAVMVAGQFAMLAIVPVALVLYGSLRDTNVPLLRWSGAALAAVYATPLALWAIGPERAQSLSKDMHPALAGLVVAAAVAVAVVHHVARSKKSVANAG
ncbi:hypothetical protein [Kibdelosporangium phytohabitans]|uniref:Uncharacterized protein n=1 Tax=Kibdelosporangium phytohabitans TaxID=860235 RepID=A0A0N9I7P2_9PSEU|nr:hypothetical protein [Kibdelosporangium phytohabitans]ALG10644.1 hypothetical protein AOZ06_30450 [Kibdelosporangium phytohabitans]MBE1461764.1 hypothetical protein [Kibdelosporangium phytohabitans]